MATPFPISAPRDLLSKAKRELDRLIDEAEGMCGEPNPISIADLTINTAWSLWHVTDWIANNDDPVVAELIARKGIKKPVGEERAYAFQNQLRSESADLEICWALALRFKHFELEADSRARAVLDDEDAVLSAPAAEISERDFAWLRTEGAPTFSKVVRPLDFSAGAVASISEPSRSTLHPKVTHQGNRLRLTDVYGRAYAFLDTLLRKHGL